MRDPIYEQALNNEGVKWRYVAKVLMKEIDLKKGLHNQARYPDPLVPGMVERYSSLMAEGNEFPAVVVAKTGNKYHALDGNHRLAAHNKLGKTEIDAYVVESTDPAVLDRITWFFNNQVNGMRLSEEALFEHAVAMVQIYGKSCGAMAKITGFSEHKLGRRVRNEKMKAVLGAAKESKVASKLSDEIFHRLSPIFDMGDDIFVPCAKVLADCGATARQAEELADKVKRARTHSAKLAAIGEFASSDKVIARKAETKGGKIRPRVGTAREKLERLIDQSLSVLEDNRKDALMQPTEESRKAFRIKAADLVQKLTRTFGLSSTLQGLDD